MKSFAILLVGTILITFSKLGCSLGISGVHPTFSPTLSLVTSSGNIPLPSDCLTPSSSNTFVTNESILFTLTPSTTDTPSLTHTPTLNPLACVPQDLESEYGLVKWIVDGDTIVVDIQGRLHTVRYLGIETPGFIPITEYRGPTAARFNEELVRNQLVRMVKDGTDRDKAGQLLRYVFVGDIFVNFELVRQGLAYVFVTYPELFCESTFQKAEDLAALELRGIWEATQTPHRTSTPSMSSTAAILPTIIPVHTNTVNSTSTSTQTPISTPASTFTPIPPLTFTATPTLTFTLTSTLTLTPTLQPSGTITGTIGSSILIAGN